MKRGANKHNGFTIVELLIVIIVIGILAALMLNTLAQAQTKAQAASLGDGLKKIDKSLTAYGIEKGVSSWWLEGDNALLGGGNLNISSIISNNPGFAKFLQQAPVVSGLPNIVLAYDNGNDVYNGCSANSTGVNVIARSLDNLAVATELDKMFDDGVTNCGNIRYLPATGNLVYGLSRGQEFE